MKKSLYTAEERALFERLNSPQKIQDYLNTLEFNFEKKVDTCRSPRMLIRTGLAHCMEGALFAAAALEFHGEKPLVLDLRSSAQPLDVDHVITVFKKFGCFGAISKTNHAVLRYREPVYKSTRELAMSFFHEYFLSGGEKTMREYSRLLDLTRFDDIEWRTSEKDLFQIPNFLDNIRHYPIVNAKQIKNLRLADPIEIEAGKIVQQEP